MYQVPYHITEKVARTTLEELKEISPVDTGWGINSYKVIFGNGYIKIMGEKYMLIYQNRGFKGFVMKALAGKIIPMRNKYTGQITFRYANPEVVGKHRITMRDPRTGRIMVGNNPYHWAHPGLKGKFFIEKSIKKAVRTHSVEIMQDFIMWHMNGAQ